MIVTSHKPGSHGYIQLRVNKVAHQLHRVICERKHGELNGRMALHSCDNRICINPDHIRPGTPLDNMIDMAQRERWKNGVAQGRNHVPRKRFTTPLLPIT